jgi:beta-phosphoglucomutase-like phosphatase (HAD superfamily)/dTDP-glucose pyrophosphorylase
MNKLIIFDLDGVLVDSKDWHYQALNESLEQIDKNLVISYEEHLAYYDGLNTTKKLELLTEKKGLDKKYYNQIWENKQKATFKVLKKLTPNCKLISIFEKIKEKNYYIAVASNSIRESVKLCLLNLGLLEFVDYYVSNEDVKHPKPFPEMYWKCMSVLKCLPKNTIIVEDSHIGRQGALDSGANLLSVEDCEDLTENKVMNKINEMNETNKENNIPWIDKKLNVLIPMAGRGNRFKEKGYTFPKPLIEVFGKPMIQLVVDNLNIQANYIFLVLKEHYDTYQLKHLLNLLAPNCQIVEVDQVTEGAACTTLLAKDLINNENPLLIANSDQFVEWNSNETMYSFSNNNIDGGMLVFNSVHPKWSFAKLDKDGFIEKVAEKDPISDIASVGVYYWSKGSDYVKYAEKMIEKNIRVNGEFYVCPVINEAIEDVKKFKVKFVEKMYGIGTPEDLDYFIENYKK